MVTIDDVARHAGVSRSTVSYVLSRKRKISETTREQVIRSIELLGFQPDARARALAGRRTYSIGLVAPLRADNNVPVIMQFVASVAAAARRHDHDVLLVTQEEGVAGVRRVSRTALVDAVIVMDVESRDPRIPILCELNRPCVLIGLPDEPAGLPCVDLDFRQAAGTCVDHLAELGHRHVCLLGSPAAVYERHSSYAMTFRAGFDRAAERLHLVSHTYPTEPSYDAVDHLVDEVFRNDPRTTGLVVHNEAAIGAVLSALRHQGRDIPRDVSVVAICPEDLALNQRVQLSAVAVPAESIGATAVDLVLRQLDGEHLDGVHLIVPTLVPRESTAAAPPPTSQATGGTQ